MPYEIIRAPQFRRDVRQVARYLLREAGDTVSRTYLRALEHDLEVVITNSPNIFGWFHETGEPYRAKLFRVGRTVFWIIYIVDDENRRVEIFRLWNAARQPTTHGL